RERAVLGAAAEGGGGVTDHSGDRRRSRVARCARVCGHGTRRRAGARGTVGAARDRDAALPALDRRSQPLEERALRAPRGPGAARARRAPPAQAHRMDGAGLTTVFRSRRRRECDERLLVLTAVGVEGFVAPAPDWSEFLLQVDAARVQRGEWWRAWTALTLHLDGPHLAANLGAGVWFGYLAGRQMGVGTAWLLTVTGAALANLLEGLTGPPEHQAVGASTAVF